MCGRTFWEEVYRSDLYRNMWQGVNGRLPHDHVFYKDGRFASVDDRMIDFGDPQGDLIPFRFGNDGDTVT